MQHSTGLAKSAGGAGGARIDLALRTLLLEVLEEHRRAGECWLEQQHAALRQAVERACGESARSTGASNPVAVGAMAPVGVALPAAGSNSAAEGATASAAAEAARAVTPAMQPRSGASSTLTEKALTPRQSAAESNEGSSRTTSRHESKPSSNSEINKLMTRVHTRKFVGTLLQEGEDIQLAPGTIRYIIHKYLFSGAVFDMIIGCLIILNTAMMFVQLEVHGRAANHWLSQEGSGALPDHDDSVFNVLSHIFNGIFLVELILRFYVYRCHFWQSLFNIIDFFLMLITSLDAYILSHVGSGPQNVSFIRMVRIVRMGRALRVIRTMGLFRQLRVLLNTIAVSVMSLFWSMLILFIFMIMSALFLCQMLQSYVADLRGDFHTRDWVNRHYGTPLKALYTMFEATFSGCWPNYARPLIEQVGITYAFFFVVYVTGVIFAMVRIISALFLKDTLQTASNDADLVCHQRMQETRSTMAKLLHLFMQADETGDGFISRREFLKIMEYPKVKLWMSSLNMDLWETDTLFEVLDNGDGLISLEEFVSGMMRLKGTARSQDVLFLQRDCQRILSNLEMLKRKEDAMLRAVGAEVPAEVEVCLPGVGAQGGIRRPSTVKLAALAQELAGEIWEAREEMREAGQEELGEQPREADDRADDQDNWAGDDDRREALTYTAAL